MFHCGSAYPRFPANAVSDFRVDRWHGIGREPIASGEIEALHCFKNSHLSCGHQNAQVYLMFMAIGFFSNQTLIAVDKLA
jgi:hypothetical protein